MRKPLVALLKYVLAWTGVTLFILTVWWVSDTLVGGPQVIVTLGRCPLDRCSVWSSHYYQERC